MKVRAGIRWFDVGAFRVDVPLLIGVVTAFALLAGPAVRVGDGAEYYALFFAWKETLLPFMTERSWDAYARLVASGAIKDLIPAEVLRASFPALRLGNGADFNHFWFYSALAASIGAIASALRIMLTPHSAFLAIHALLIAMPLIIGRRLFGWAGVAVVLALTLFSPMIWYVDKVHTEFFTYCLVLSSAMLFLNCRYIAAAFLLAVTSTQNLSFAGVALVPIIVDFVIRGRRPYSTCESLLLACTAILILLHPAYYFFRYGVMTAQFLAGGARLGTAWSEWYVWLLDPDIGLFPNWWLAVILIAVAAIARWKGQHIAKQAPGWWAFVLIYLLVGLAAQSSTENLNSGATPGIARYALWYVPLFFPLGMTAIHWASVRVSRQVLVGALVLTCFIYNWNVNRPQLPESYETPSAISLGVQRYLPWLYDPPAEIFAERYSGLGESIWQRGSSAVVIGPDCRKALILPKRSGVEVFDEQGCAFNLTQMGTILRSRLTDNAATKPATFIRLNGDEIARGMLPCVGRIDLADTGNFAELRVSGLGAAENHGRWNTGANALFSCALPQSAREEPRKARLLAHGFVPAGRGQRMRIQVNDVALPVINFVVPDEKSIELIIPKDAKVLRLRLEFPDRISPHELGLSDDARKLGVGIRAIEFE